MALAAKAYPRCTVIDLERPVTRVAPALLGALLRHETAEGLVVVEITEVEAYDGERDPASHAFRGPTPRNAIMYGPPGHLYVYRSMGMHWCVNVVTGPEGRASAVLLRAGTIIEGIEIARERRGPRISDRDLARGPGRLCQALGITGDHYGIDLFTDGPLRLEVRQTPLAKRLIASGPRVGVSGAADIPWRFWVDGDRSVSAYRRSPRA